MQGKQGASETTGKATNSIHLLHITLHQGGTDMLGIGKWKIPYENTNTRIPLECKIENLSRPMRQGKYSQ
jgi:hypothetical protein